MKKKEVQYFVGLDLGQKRSFTAIAVVERSVVLEERRDPIYWTLDWVALGPPEFAVRHLERVPLGTSYVEVVADVRAMLGSDAMRGHAELFVDATGAGAPVVDLFRAVESLRPVMTPVVITNGGPGQESAGKGFRERLVPRQDLVAGLLVMLEEKNLAIARGMPDTKVLIEELVQFGREDGKRSDMRDDLAMALALAVWGARREDKSKKKMTAKQQQDALDFLNTLFGVSGDRRTHL
jgi:hypothetical protein